MAAWSGGGVFLGRLAEFSTRHARWVIAGWLVFGAALAVLVPPLEKVVEADATPFIPKDAAAVRAYEDMDRAFGSGQAEGLAFVVVRDDRGIDDGYYRALVERLEAGNDHIVEVQSYVDSEQLEQALISADGKATYLPIAIRHPVGSPEAIEDIGWVRDVAAENRPAGTEAYVTGDPALVTDLSTSLNNSIARVTVVTVVVITILLLLLYRSFLTPLIPLVTIGVSLLAARGSVALIGDTVFNVSTYTSAFLTALVLGAGTDYTIFLISRYHEALRKGEDVRPAIVTATRRIGAVIAASGATVIIGSACMAAAELSLFSTTGPAIAVAVFVTLLVSLTFTPALLSIAGRRVGPSRSSDASETRWARVGAFVAAQPGRVAFSCLIVLGALAALYPSMSPEYDTRSIESQNTDATAGYRALDEHFPPNELRPDYVLIESDHDMRNARDFATLDAVTDGVSKVPQVESVRSATRPEGRPIPKAQLQYGIGEVGKRLDNASDEVRAGSSEANRLADGSDRLAGGADDLADGTGKAQSAVDQFLAGLQQEAVGLNSAIEGTGDARAGATELAAGARQLSAELRDAHDQTKTTVNYLGVIYRSLRADQLCTLDPICNEARRGIGEIYRGQRDELLPGLDQAANAADDIAAGNGDLATGLGDLRAGLDELHGGIDELQAGEHEFRSKLGDLAQGAKQIASGAEQIPAGVGQLDTATRDLAVGLDEASDFLTETADDARAAGINAFYIPPGAMDNDDFALARAYFMSKNGHTARMLVFTEGDADRVVAEEQAVKQALRDTPLEDARVYATGPHAITNDIQRLAEKDFKLVALVVLIAVLLILLLLLRSVVAPIYLLGSVVLSYAAAMGVTTLIWQHLLNEPMDWTVPLLSFIVLVAVGADYNILLMSRVREESGLATRAGVARAVAATGGTITSAGLIFAGSFVAMLSAPVLGLKETGTAVSIGLLLDTFIVRSMFVPSIAALLGRWNWWPTGRPRPTDRVEHREPEPETVGSR